MPMLPLPADDDETLLTIYESLSDWVRAIGERNLTDTERDIWHALCERFDARTCEFDTSEWARLYFYRWLYECGRLNEGV